MIARMSRRIALRGRRALGVMLAVVLVLPIALAPVWWSHAEAAPGAPSGPFLPGDEPAGAIPNADWKPTGAKAQSVSSSALPSAGSPQRKAWDASEKRRADTAAQLRLKAKPMRADGPKPKATVKNIGAKPLLGGQAALSFPPGCEPLGGEPWFAEYFPGDFIRLADKNGPGAVSVRLVNHGTQTWTPGQVSLGYHRLDDNNNEIEPGSTPLTAIPAAVDSGESVQIEARFDFLPPGAHNIAWDVWVNGLGWLSNHGVCAGMVRYTLPNQPPSIQLGWPPNVGTVNTLTPVLSATADDPDNWPSEGRLTYQFVVCTNAAFTIGCQQSPWLDTPLYVLPEGRSWGETFWWKARVNDGAGTTDPGTAGHRVTIVVPAPADWATVGTGMGMASVRGVVFPYGTWTRTEQDAVAAGAGVPLQILRTYSSAASDNTRTAFGRGWLSMFDASFRITNDGTTYTVTYPDARQEVFGRQPDGTIVSRLSSGATNAIVIDPSGAATVRTSAQEVLRFDPDGQLARIENTGLGALRFVRDTSGVVTEVVQEPSGSRVRLSWSNGESSASCGQWYPPTITTVTLDPVAAGAPPSQWNYRYSCGRLIEVCDPTGACSPKEEGTATASVAPATAARTAEGRAHDRLVSSTAWTTGGDYLLPFDYRKMKVRTAAGTLIEYYFMRPAVGHLEQYVEQHNSYGGVAVEVCYHPVDAECSQIESYYFDEANRLRVQTHTALSVLQEMHTQRRWDYSEINGEFLAFFDENFNGMSMHYDASGNLLGSTTFRDPNTEVFHGTQLYGPTNGAALDGRVRRLSESPVQMPANPIEDNFFYDTEGRLVRQVGNRAQDANGSPLGGTETTYSYTTGSEPAVGGRPGGTGGTMPVGLLRTATASGGTTYLFYNKQGDLTEITGPAGLHTRYAYDGVGQRISETSTGSSIPPGGTVNYQYDVAGRVAQQIFPSLRNAVTSEIVQRRVCTVYDQDGLVTASIDTAGATCAQNDPQARVTAYEYDQAGRLSASVEPDGGRTTYTYDWFDRISSITGPRGNTVWHDYDSLGRLIAVRSHSGPADSPTQVILATYGYDPAGRKIAESDVLGRTVRYEWTGDDLMTRAVALNVANAQGQQVEQELWLQQYDAIGRVIERVDGGKRKQTWLYDPEGKLVETVLDPGGLNRIRRYAYDTAGRISSESLTNGTRVEQTRYTYDAAGHVLSSTVENGGADLTTYYTYDARGLVLSVTGPRASAAGDPAYTTNYTYDIAGQLTSVISPPIRVEEYGQPARTERPTQTFGYDAFGALTHSRDPRGNISVTAYDTAGRITSQTQPDYVPPGTSSAITAQWRYGYDFDGNLLSKTDPAGGVTDFTYDINGNLTEVKAPAVNGQRASTTYVYDQANQLKATTNPIGRRSDYGIDVLGRTTFRIDWIRCGETGGSRCGIWEQFTYDTLDNVTSIVDNNDTEQHYEYNVAGEMTSEHVSGLSTQTTTTYDLAGRVSRVIDRRGESTGYAYDLAGRLRVASYTGIGSNPQVVQERFNYDAAGNPSSYINPAEVTTTFEFDATNQLVSAVQPIDVAGTTITTTAGYDAAGNRTRVTDGNNNATWRTYNTWNGVERVIEPATAVHLDEADRKWTIAYDRRGLSVGETQPGGVTVNRTFDPAGNLLTETGAGGPNAPPATRTFTYDLANRLTSASHPGGQQTYNYTETDWLLNSSGPAGTSLFTYDAGGRTTSRTDSNGTSTYTWTSFDALRTSTDPLSGTTETYTYDPAGNLSERVHSDGTYTSYTYGFRGRVEEIYSGSIRTPIMSELHYTYDLVGNVTNKSQLGYNAMPAHANIYTYDLANRLTSWTQSRSGTDTTHSYGWDKANNRTGQVVNTAGTVTSTSEATFDERNRPLQTETRTRNSDDGTDVTELTSFAYTRTWNPFEGHCA